ncbi:MAG: hypothetical protein EGR19_05090 [Dialister sp.]|nr:hypothetical protein [Dialister sp.]
MVSGYTFFASQRMKKISSLLRIPIQKYLPQGGARPLLKKAAPRSIPASAIKKLIHWMGFFSF